MARDEFWLEGPSHDHKFDHGLAGISWPFCPMLLGMLIPRWSDDFVDRPFNGLFLYWRKKSESVSHSVVSRSLWPTRLLCLWNSPCKNTGVGSHSLLQGIIPTQGSMQVFCIASRFFLSWVTLTVAKSLWTTCLTSLSWSRKLFLLPISRVKLL